MKKLYIFALMVAFLMTAAVADDDPPPRNKPATVTIITNPPNSDVYLGGELLGKSPIENMQVQSGRQTLIVIDQGYELVNQRVNVVKTPTRPTAPLSPSTTSMQATTSCARNAPTASPPKCS